MIERVLTDRLGGADRPAVFPGPLLLAVVALSACGGASAGEAGGMTATAEIRSCSDSEITGTATFRERPSSEGVKLVDISLEVRGLTDGSHAVHVHETGSCEPCGSAGGHHDPGAFGNTTPDAPDYNHPFHGGDLVNLVVAEGVGTRTMTSSRFTLSPGRMSLFDEDGSALIIHTNTDTYCDQAGELEAGCAGGARDACGVLVLGESGAD